MPSTPTSGCEPLPTRKLGVKSGRSTKIRSGQAQTARMRTRRMTTTTRRPVLPSSDPDRAEVVVPVEELPSLAVCPSDTLLIAPRPGGDGVGGGDGSGDVGDGGAGGGGEYPPPGAGGSGGGGGGGGGEGGGGGGGGFGGGGGGGGGGEGAGNVAVVAARFDTLVTRTPKLVER